MSDMPGRELYLRFQIDTNRINSKRGIRNMNCLERWREDELIEILISETAQEEARAGSDPRRERKALGYVFSQSLPTTSEEQDELRRIECALFPVGAANQNQRNDVDIVFNASKYRAILVTADGGSRSQPGGILGNRDALAALGIQVMTDAEAVALVEERIRDRDEMARLVAAQEGVEVPRWVGTDGCADRA